MRTNKNCDIRFYGERLQELRERNHVSLTALATALGISPNVISMYETGTQPGIKNLALLADYFEVPVEYFIRPETPDRKETDDAIRAWHDKKLISYEAFLSAGNEVQSFDQKVVAPWPYNLLETIFQGWDSRLTEDQLAGLTYALSSISDKEERAIRMYYQEELTLKEAGDKFGVTRERCRQIIAKGLRRLRHPSRSKYIRYGLSGTSLREDELEQRSRDLLERERAVKEAEKKIASRPLQTFAQESFLSSRKDQPIDDLPLSVRSYNGLKNGGINTVDELCRAVRDGSLYDIRGLGKGSFIEILQLVL